MIFLDETGFIRWMNRLYGWAPIGEQAVITASKNGKRLSVIGAMAASGPLAAMSYTGTLNEERMLEFIADHLGPTLKPGDVLVMDGLRVHWTKRVLAALDAYGVKTLLLPPYCPELNPIEMLWSTMKARVRKSSALTWEALVDMIALIWDTMDTCFFSRWVTACGYTIQST